MHSQSPLLQLELDSQLQLHKSARRSILSCRLTHHHRGTARKQMERWETPSGNHMDNHPFLDNKSMPLVKYHSVRQGILDGPALPMAQTNHSNPYLATSLVCSQGSIKSNKTLSSLNHLNRVDVAEVMRIWVRDLPLCVTSWGLKTKVGSHEVVQIRQFLVQEVAGSLARVKQFNYQAPILKARPRLVEVEDVVVAGAVEALESTPTRRVIARAKDRTVLGL